MPLEIERNPVVSSEQRNELSEKMFRECAKLSDFDADVLDLLSNVWISRVKTLDNLVMADVDELLSLRGLKPKRGEGGRVSGYRPVQRAALIEAIERIGSLWIEFSRLEIFNARTNGKRTKQCITAQSRAFMITDRFTRECIDGRLETVKIVFRPGGIFSQFLLGPGRQIALLAKQAIAYDPYRRKWEKRLARYLSWQWRNRASSGTYMNPFRVCTLLRSTEIDATRKSRPHRVRWRLEKALDTLQDDHVIKGWQYEGWDEPVTNRSGWFEVWLNAKVMIEPPETITTQYQCIVRPKAIKTHIIKGACDAFDERLRQQRIQQGLTLLVAAEQIGIHPTLLCRIEKGTRSPSRSLRTKIEKWLDSVDRV
jgi:DNA-binding XRE family transcriptional regulator